MFDPCGSQSQTAGDRHQQNSRKAPAEKCSLPYLASKNQLPCLIVSIGRKWVNICKFCKCKIHHSNSLSKLWMIPDSQRIWYDKGDCYKFSNPEFYLYQRDNQRDLISFRVGQIQFVFFTFWVEDVQGFVNIHT